MKDVRVLALRLTKRRTVPRGVLRRPRREAVSPIVVGTDCPTFPVTRRLVDRTYVQSVGSRVANGEPLVSEVAMAKNTAVDACDFVVDEAVQLHGGLGYLRDAEVERHYREARIMGIGGGTTEIMNESIARQLGV